MFSIILFDALKIGRSHYPDFSRKPLYLKKEETNTVAAPPVIKSSKWETLIRCGEAHINHGWK